MNDFIVTIEEGKEWKPADHVEGIPDCLVCHEPLLMIGGAAGAYGYCLTCKQYYTLQDTEAGDDAPVTVAR